MFYVLFFESKFLLYFAVYNELQGEIHSSSWTTSAQTISGPSDYWHVEVGYRPVFEDHDQNQHHAT